MSRIHTYVMAVVLDAAERQVWLQNTEAGAVLPKARFVPGSDWRQSLDALAQSVWRSTITDFAPAGLYALGEVAVGGGPAAALVFKVRVQGQPVGGAWYPVEALPETLPLGEARKIRDALGTTEITVR